MSEAWKNNRNELQEDVDQFLKGYRVLEEGFLGAEIPKDEDVPAEKAILGRRSAVAMDGSTSISRATFFRMMARLLPWGDGASMPWDAIAWRPRIHLALFAHRVHGLPPGLFAPARDPEKLTTLMGRREEANACNHASR